MSQSSKGLFIVWNPFQRRAQSLAAMFDLDLVYFHYAWERRSRVHKALSYVGKFTATLAAILRRRPRYVFVQLAPTPLLYAAALARALTGSRFAADCHNTMLYDAGWINWPLAKRLLRSADITLVHNTDVQRIAEGLQIPTRILRDPLPVMRVDSEITQVAGITLQTAPYVIIPCSMAEDEPVAELFRAAAQLPDLRFVVTWYADRLPPALRRQAPPNLHFTGFLPEPEFNALYAHARAAIVLSTREGTQPSGASEAIALGIPLVISSLQTTQRLYGEAVCFVENTADGIAAGVRRTVADRPKWQQRVGGLREALRRDAAQQVAAIQAQMR